MGQHKITSERECGYAYWRLHTLEVSVRNLEADLAKKNNNTKKAKLAQKPIPAVLSINICDAIIRDEATKKVSLIGLFNTIRANSLPCTHPQMHVHVALTNGHGKYKTEVRFVSMETDKPIAGMLGDLEFPDPLHVVELNVCWQGLRFETEGIYLVQVLCGGETVGERKFMVVGPQQQMPPTDGTEAR